jgi:uncharacterized membrane protein required for colicin V production
MFNENKYKKCINHLIGIKTSIVIFSLVIFAILGGFVGFALMQEFTNEVMTVVISAIVGAIVGIILGLFSTWRVEMKIQEAYWRIDTLNELKKQNSQKNAPIAKAVVSIKNNQNSKPKDKNSENKETEDNQENSVIVSEEE